MNLKIDTVGFIQNAKIDIVLTQVNPITNMEIVLYSGYRLL